MPSAETVLHRVGSRLCRTTRTQIGRGDYLYKKVMKAVQKAERIQDMGRHSKAWLALLASLGCHDKEGVPDDISCTFIKRQQEQIFYVWYEPIEVVEDRINSVL